MSESEARTIVCIVLLRSFEPMNENFVLVLTLLLWACTAFGKQFWRHLVSTWQFSANFLWPLRLRLFLRLLRVKASCRFLFRSVHSSCNVFALRANLSLPLWDDRAYARFEKPGENTLTNLSVLNGWKLKCTQDQNTCSTQTVRLFHVSAFSTGSG